MAHLSTNYMGLTLKNPLIAGACNLSMDPGTASRMEEAGAAAIVFKSLFEEQINLESLEMEESLHAYDERHAEMISLFPEVKHAGPEEHLEKLRKLKEAVGIPVIGSLNCVNRDTWAEYARKIEETGVDALELNFYAAPDSFEKTGKEKEQEQIDILNEVIRKVKIPVSVKLSPFYTNPLQVIRKMDAAGVNGFVLFNRLFQPDIDPKKGEHHFPFNLSQPMDYRLPLRYAGLLHNEIKGSLCANTGIFTGEDMAKMILAGADCVQVVSALYKNKVGYIKDMLNDLSVWMEAAGYDSLDAFRGKLSRANSKDPYAYQRAQYVDLLMKPFEVMKKYPQR